jgi:hypothetical protein
MAKGAAAELGEALATDSTWVSAWVAEWKWELR